MLELMSSVSPFRLWEAPALPDVSWHGDHVLVTRFQLVRDILRDPVLFSPANALDAVTPVSATALRTMARHGFRLPPTLANNDTFTHPGIRALVSQALTPAKVSAQRPWLNELVTQRATRIQARLAAGHDVDLYREIAVDVPLLVLGRLLALPHVDTVALKTCCAQALDLFWGDLDSNRQNELADHVGQFHAQLRAFAETAGGLIGQIREFAKQQQLSSDHAVAVLFFLLVAGQETTSQFLGLLLYRLLREPTVASAVANEEISVTEVVEEALRIDSPIVSWRRRTTRPLHLGGHALPAHTPLVLCLRMASMDADIHGSPHEFIPGQRGSRRHLAFGLGAHRCIGAGLARLEAHVVLAALAPALPSLHLIRSPRFGDNLSFQIPDALWVRAKP